MGLSRSSEGWPDRSRLLFFCGPRSGDCWNGAYRQRRRSAPDRPPASLASPPRTSFCESCVRTNGREYVVRRTCLGPTKTRSWTAATLTGNGSAGGRWGFFLQPGLDGKGGCASRRAAGPPPAWRNSCGAPARRTRVVLPLERRPVARALGLGLLAVEVHPAAAVVTGHPFVDLGDARYLTIHALAQRAVPAALEQDATGVAQGDVAAVLRLGRRAYPRSRWQNPSAYHGGKLAGGGGEAAPAPGPRPARNSHARPPWPRVRARCPGARPYEQTA